MNSDLPSTESVTNNSENIPEIEVAFFHEGFFCFFTGACVLMILQFTRFCQVGIVISLE